MTKVNTEFLDILDPDFDATPCMNCGTCTALCPMEIGLLPRQLFRHAMLGLQDKVLEDEDPIFSCLLCRMCEINCPAKVPITENVRLLRKYFGTRVYGLTR